MFKPGLIAIAQRTGAVLFPVHVRARWCWRAPTWDHPIVPLPGTRIIFRFGEGTRVPAELSRGVFEQQRKELEASYREESARLEATLGRSSESVVTHPD